MEKNLMDIYRGISNLEFPEDLSPGVMAYLGDAIFELYIRTRKTSEGYCNTKELHKNTTEMVKAQTQMDAIMRIMDKLNDEEVKIFKRGRNISSHNIPKNASVSQYRHATGFETLLGFLYIRGRFERLLEILDMAYKSQLS